jgi:hypothetical protein
MRTYDLKHLATLVALAAAAAACSPDRAGPTAPLDLDLAAGDHLLYVLEGGAGNVGGFAVNADGSLTPIGTVTAGAPASGLQGLAAY